MVANDHFSRFVDRFFSVFFHEMIEDNQMIEVDHEENYKYQVNNTHQLLKQKQKIKHSRKKRSVIPA
jgi:hypothetical protein